MFFHSNPIKMIAKEELKPTLWWTRHFYEDYAYNHLRFKFLRNNTIPFDFPEELLDRVSERVYCRTERRRIPLFIGTQFGIYPRFETVSDLFGKEKLIAVLGKSLLSGHVGSLSIFFMDVNVHPDHNADPLGEMILQQKFNNSLESKY
jgi:hypothetical protein